MRKIFIDCGAFDGDSIRAFKKMDVYDESYEFFAFEPNPLFHESFSDCVLDKRAVWVKDGEIDFYLAKESNGSTTEKDKFSGGIDYNHPIKVPSVDIDKWIKDNFSKDDYIILKMDIEGGEFKVIPHMIANGSMEYVNECWLETHSRKITSISENQSEELIKSIKNAGVIYKYWH